MSGSSKSRRLACGIDLGTTNSAMALADFGPGAAAVKPQIHSVEQLVGLGELQARTMLPSAVYLMGEGELTAQSIQLPWADAPNLIVGEPACLARRCPAGL